MTPHTPLTENARIVLEKRYLIRDENNQVLETPAHLFQRVARFIAEGDFLYGVSQDQVEKTEHDFQELLSKLDFIPNSPTLMNADRPLGQLSACFVLPVEDSIESIFETLKHAALIHQSGGGTGFSFSKLRPRNDVVRSTMGVSSGPVSFMEVYNAATEAIKQGGTRRGANMGILRVDHPDIELFIRCKQDTTKITNFNISVAVTDTFMEAVAADADFDLIHPKTGLAVKTLPARDLFDQIIESAWKTGEPGLIFIDRINEDNPTPTLGEIESTNPCGEVPLLPYEACNLGSINLGHMVANKSVDWEKLADVTRKVTHFLDNVISQNRFPIPEIKAMVEGNRKIGIGVMGWADLLIGLGIPYNSDEALALGRDVAAWIDYHSKKASIELAKIRGPFPNFKHSRYAQGAWLTEKFKEKVSRTIRLEEWQALDSEIRKHGLRNATTTCIAPTGTISIIAGASGGIEPLFGVVFIRNVLREKDGKSTEMTEIHPEFEALAKANGFYSEALIQEIAALGTIQSLEAIPADIRRIFVTAHDIPPEWHVRMQTVFQEHSDNGVSKTINFPQEATREDIATTYRSAYQLGAKGITVYRHNSRGEQPMALRPEAPKATAVASEKANVFSHLEQCPECGEILQPGPGCMLCPSCAYSPCV